MDGCPCREAVTNCELGLLIEELRAHHLVQLLKRQGAQPGEQQQQGGGEQQQQRRAGRQQGEREQGQAPPARQVNQGQGKAGAPDFFWQVGGVSCLLPACPPARPRARGGGGTVEVDVACLPAWLWREGLPASPQHAGVLSPCPVHCCFSLPTGGGGPAGSVQGPERVPTAVPPPCPLPCLSAHRWWRPRRPPAGLPVPQRQPTHPPTTPPNPTPLYPPTHQVVAHLREQSKALSRTGREGRQLARERWEVELSEVVHAQDQPPRALTGAPAAPTPPTSTGAAGSPAGATAGSLPTAAAALWLAAQQQGQQAEQAAAAPAACQPPGSIIHPPCPNRPPLGLDPSSSELGAGGWAGGAQVEPSAAPDLDLFCTDLDLSCIDLDFELDLALMHELLDFDDLVADHAGAQEAGQQQLLPRGGAGWGGPSPGGIDAAPGTGRPSSASGTASGMGVGRKLSVTPRAVERPAKRGRLVPASPRGDELDLFDP